MKKLFLIPFLSAFMLSFALISQPNSSLVNDKDAYYLMFGELTAGIYSKDKIAEQAGIKLKSSNADNFSHPVLKFSVLIVSADENVPARLIRKHINNEAGTEFDLSHSIAYLKSGDKLIFAEVFIENANNESEELDVHMVIQIE